MTYNNLHLLSLTYTDFHLLVLTYTDLHMPILTYTGTSTLADQLRLPQTIAGTFKVSKKAKAKVLALVSKMPADAMVGDPASPSLPGIMGAKDMMGRKRAMEPGG